MTTGIYKKEKLDINGKINEFINRNSDGNAGAINIFIGKVKRTGINKEVKKLYLEAYTEVANKELKSICKELKKKYNLSDIEIVHGIGEFDIGESIVYVAIASKSRKNMYKAMKEAIEMYKTRPPIFKKEIYIDGSCSWI